jgi:hypothetical protein
MIQSRMRKSGIGCIISFSKQGSMMMMTRRRRKRRN